MCEAFLIKSEEHVEKLVKYAASITTHHSRQNFKGNNVPQTWKRIGREESDFVFSFPELDITYLLICSLRSFYTDPVLLVLAINSIWFSEISDYKIIF